MENNERFEFIKKCKYSRDLHYDHYVQTYLQKNIDATLAVRESISISDLNQARQFENISGVYLMFLRCENKVIFTYVGESINIYQRWKQHASNISHANDTLYRKLRKRLAEHPDWNQMITFVLLERDLEDQNNRLYRETHNIYKFKSRNYSLNNKNCSRKLKCPDGHGLCRTWLAHIWEQDKMKLVVMGKSLNKKCKSPFIIK